MKQLTTLFLLGCCASTSLFADPTTVINNNNNNGSSGGYGCGNNNTNNGPYVPPGTYMVQNPNGSSSTIYTTGNKQPYIVDNQCSQPIQPYVYAQPPAPPGPTNGVGPVRGQRGGMMGPGPRR